MRVDTATGHLMELHYHSPSSCPGHRESKGHPRRLTGEIVPGRWERGEGMEWRGRGSGRGGEGEVGAKG